MRTMILIEEDGFKELLSKIDRIEKFLTIVKDVESKESDWVSNEKACELLNVTSRTMQNYRDNGIIPFSKVGSKIYYKQGDLDEHFQSHYYPAFKIERRES